MLQKCDHLVACSSLVKDIFAPFFQKPITVINSSIKYSEWKSHRKNKTTKSNKIIKIIGSGTVCYRKGTDLFIEVADILRSPFVEFIWLGKKNNNAFSEIIRFKNEKIKSVSFIETKNLEEYLTYLKQGDIFLSTSREESMGLVIMEAQALGMPVVATDSGGSTLLVHEKDGKIVKELNPEAISIGLKEVMNNLSSYNAIDKLKYDYTIEFQKLAILLQNPLS
jgi:glycosyltransferase involved in cell wall biosynthesis